MPPGRLLVEVHMDELMEDAFETSSHGGPAPPWPALALGASGLFSPGGDVVMLIVAEFVRRLPPGQRVTGEDIVGYVARIKAALERDA